MQEDEVSRKENSFQKVKSDNRPSNYEYALMSEQVYKGESLKIEEPLPEYPDWKVKKTQTGNLNYFGVIYVNAKTKQVVLAHRGTNSLVAWIENLRGIYSNYIDTTHKTNIFSFIDSAIEVCREAYNLGYSESL